MTRPDREMECWASDEADGIVRFCRSVVWACVGCAVLFWLPLLWWLAS